MAVVSFKRGNKAFIDSLPIVDGQLIFNTETGEMYEDVGSKRIPMSTTSKKSDEKYELINTITWAKGAGLEISKDSAGKSFACKKIYIRTLTTNPLKEHINLICLDSKGSRVGAITFFADVNKPYWFGKVYPDSGYWWGEYSSASETHTVYDLMKASGEYYSFAYPVVDDLFITKITSGFILYSDSVKVELWGVRA